jgi:hypothetical protein
LQYFHQSIPTSHKWVGTQLRGKGVIQNKKWKNSFKKIGNEMGQDSKTLYIGRHVNMNMYENVARLLGKMDVSRLVWLEFLKKSQIKIKEKDHKGK